MKKLTLYILVALLALTSCVQKSEYERTLGLLSKVNSLSKDGGSTQVGVFSNTSWTVEMEPKVSWASIDRLSGYKSGYLVFDYEINYGRARRVNLVFKAGDETMSMRMYQSSYIADSDCVLELTVDNDVLNVPASGTVEEIPFSTNLAYNIDEMYLTLSYPVIPDTPWITLESIDAEKVVIKVAPNDSGKSRLANLKVSHTDAGSADSAEGEGDTVNSNTITVVQPR